MDDNSIDRELSSVHRQQQQRTTTTTTTTATTTTDLPLSSSFEATSSRVAPPPPPPPPSSSSTTTTKPKSQVTVSARHKLSPKRAASQPPSKGRNRQFEPRESLQPSRKMPEARPPTVEDDEDDDDHNNMHSTMYEYESIEDDDARDNMLDSDEYATDDNLHSYRSEEMGISDGCGSETIDLTTTSSTETSPVEKHPAAEKEKEDELEEVIGIEPDPKASSSIGATKFMCEDSNEVTISQSHTAKHNLERNYPYQSHYEHTSNRIVLIEKYARPEMNFRDHRFQESYCDTVWQKCCSDEATLHGYEDLVKVRNSSTASQNRKKRDLDAVDSDSIMFDPAHWTLQQGRLYPRRGGGGWNHSSTCCTPTAQKKFRTIPASDRRMAFQQSLTPDASNLSARRPRRSAKKSPEEEKHSASRVGEQYQADVPDFHPTQHHAHPLYRNEEVQSLMIWDCQRAKEVEQRGEDIEGFMKKAEKYMHGSTGNFQAKDLNLTMRVMEALHKGEYCVKQALKEFVKMHHKDPVYSVDLSSQQESQFMELSHDLIGKKKNFSAAASIMECRPEAVQVRYYQWKADQRAEYTKLKRERKKESDECEICGDGGFLIVCELCRKAFHGECLKPPLEVLPECDWYCQRCTHSSPARLRRVHCTDTSDNEEEDTISGRRLNLDEAKTLQPPDDQKISSGDQSATSPKKNASQRKVELLSVHKEFSPRHNQNIPGFNDSKFAKEKNTSAVGQSEAAAYDSIVIRRAIDRFTYETKLFFSLEGLLFINIGYVKKRKEVCFLGYTKTDDGQCSQAEISRSFHGKGDVFVSLCGTMCAGKTIEEVKRILQTLYNENPKRAIIAVMKYADAHVTPTYAQAMQQLQQLRNRSVLQNQVYRMANPSSSLIQGNQQVFPTNAQGFVPQSVGRHIFSSQNPCPPPQMGSNPVTDVFLESTLATMNLPNFIIFLRQHNIHTTNAFLNADVLSLAKALSSSNGFAESVAIDYICSIRMHLRQLMENRFKR